MWNVYRLKDDLGCYWQLVGSFKNEDLARHYQMKHKDEWLTKRVFENDDYEVEDESDLVLRCI